MFDDVRDLYQDIILRHSRAPLHMRRPEAFDVSALGDNPMCGDRCEVFLRFGAGQQLEEVAFQARGCAISMASADLMAEAVANRTPQEARTLAASFESLVRTGTSSSDDPALEALKPLSGVAEYPSRIKCATLPWAALLAALDGAGEATSE
jgi:nitrogen fixation protein NifU and related proteins